jgi:hypothetical protein
MTPHRATKIATLRDPAREPSMPIRYHSDLTGILVLDKDLGMSSMRAIEIARRRAGRAKAGHAGTLDPLATGVLIVAFGKATKAIDQLMATEKRYETDVDLSAFTATDDREGERREVAVATPPSREAVERALGGFLGTAKSLAKNEGKGPVEKLQKLREACAKSGWLKLGASLGSGSAKALTRGTSA